MTKLKMKNWHGVVSKKYNKYWEIQIGRFDSGQSLFEFRVKWNTKCDHAGFEFWVELFGYHFIFDIHDSRHWNYEKDRWSTHDEELAEE